MRTLSIEEFAGARSETKQIHSRFISIEYLSLSDNEFEGFFSFELIANLSKLNSFNLSPRSSLLPVNGNLLAAKVSVECHRITELQFGNNSKLSSAPEGFACNQSLQQQLPKNIGKVLPNLEHFNLSNNIFQANFPSSKKNFSGSLPKEFHIVRYSLGILRLSYNQFHVQIFPKATNFWKLYVLIANNNLFNEIMDGLLHSESIYVLDLSNNYLQGVIPSWFDKIHFTYLSISNKLLEGTLPSAFF
ncbi:unnamed protein product [Thlaspi arvense]|uniref:Uncharacterized protein n=1 Tax=Thlaspi arvense TaxID=13288 RepID=A0AAU9RUI8_THLAR|nr:unnamed protein product [Thlaspi arvense]